MTKSSRITTVLNSYNQCKECIQYSVQFLRVTVIDSFINSCFLNSFQNFFTFNTN